LFGYGQSYGAFCRLAATYVDKIFKGSKPSELPVEQPMIFELVINLATARRLNLTMPQELLLRADSVIE
jgi:putative tryptophan/tyrosine transport system substrate-binding protein